MKFKVVFLGIFIVFFKPLLAQYEQPDAAQTPAVLSPKPVTRVVRPPAPQPPPAQKPAKSVPSPPPAPKPATKPAPAPPQAPKPVTKLAPAPPQAPKPATKPAPAPPQAPKPATRPAPAQPQSAPKVNPPPAKVNLPRVNRPAADLSCFADNLFVVDSTSSVKDIFEQHRAYVENMATALAIGENGHHVGVIEYASHKRHFVKISLSDKQKKENILKRIQNLRFMTGITATGAALEQAVEELGNRRTNLQTNVIVITDGYSADRVEEVSKKLQAVPHVTVYAVTVGKIYREVELETIAGSKENVLIGGDTYNALLQKINPCGDRAVIAEATEAPKEQEPAYEAPVEPPSKAPSPPPTTRATTLPPTTRRTTTRRPVTPFTVKPHPFGISPFICNPNDPTVVNCEDRAQFERKIKEGKK